RYPHESKDELERVFDQWNNSESLFEFFEQNIKDINIPIEVAIEKVRIEARYLRDNLIKLASQNPSQLDAIFKNLKNNEVSSKLLQEKKARNRWLRLYAIKVDDNCFVITGGTI